MATWRVRHFCRPSDGKQAFGVIRADISFLNGNFARSKWPGESESGFHRSERAKKVFDLSARRSCSPKHVPFEADMESICCNQLGSERLRLSFLLLIETAPRAAHGSSRARLCGEKYERQKEGRQHSTVSANTC
jgi:hypothetical protein